MRRQVIIVMLGFVGMSGTATGAVPRSAGEASSGHAVSAQPGSSDRRLLEGTVRTTAGSPLAGATVRVVGPAEATRAALGATSTTAATTSASGGFALPDVRLPADIEVAAAGFATARLRVSQSPVEIFLAPAGLIESVIVQAGVRDAPAFRDPISGTTTLGIGELRALPSVTLDESLRVVSGFSLFRRSSSRAANPTTHGVTMRGLSASGASRGLVVLDGTPLNDGFGGWVTWTRVPGLALSSIEIERGPQGDMFGSDALGGVIRLTPGWSSPLVLSGELGSHGAAGVDAAAGTRRARYSMFGAASWFETDGTIPVEATASGAVDRRTDADWVNALGRADVRRAPVHASVTAWGGRDDRGNGTVLQRNRMSGGTVAATVTADVSPGTIVSARASYSPNDFRQTFSAVASTRATETLTSTQRTDASASRTAVEVAHAVPRAMLFVRGTLARASADFSDVRSSGTQSRQLRDDGESISAHVETTPIGRVSASAGVRREWRAAPADGADRDAATVGHLGASVRLTDRVFARGAVATGHRWPTLNELVRDFQVGAVRTLANPDLAPERARSAEIGLGFAVAARRTFSATVFHTVVDDAVANVTLPSPTGIVRQRRNAGESRATGLELDGEWAVSRASLRASVTVTRATFASSAEPAIDGNRLPQVPRASAALWATVDLPRRAHAALVWKGVSRQFDDDRNTFELGAASEVGVRVAGPAGDLTWSISLENVFDNRIEVGRTPLVTIAPGREVRVGVTWRR